MEGGADRTWKNDSAIWTIKIGSPASFSRSMACSSSLIASAPMPTRNLLPQVSLALAVYTQQTKPEQSKEVDGLEPPHTSVSYTHLDVYKRQV